MREVLTENKQMALFKSKQLKLDKNDSTNKDIDAVFNTWLYLTLIPIFPFCVPYNILKREEILEDVSNGASHLPCNIYSVPFLCVFIFDFVCY